MGLDPNIPLSGVAPRFNDPFQVLAQGRQARAEQDAAAQSATIRGQQIAQNDQQLRAGEKEAQDVEAKKLESQGIMDAADAAYKEINSGNADRILSGLDPKVRTVAEGYLAKFGEAKSKRDALAKELAQESARFSQAMGYDPVATAAAIKLNADLYPEQAEALQAVTDPAKLRKMIDHYAGNAPKAPTVAETETARHNLATEAQAAKPAVMTPYQQAGLTETGRHNRATEAGAAAGRAQAARDPRKELTPNAEANVTRQYVKQWTEATKPARDLDRQVALIDTGMTAARRGDLAQGAQTVLVAFQKILDPTSVVREAEFDRSAAGQSLMQRVRGAAERLTKGGAGIPISELEKFHALAKEAAAAQSGAYLASVKERIGRNADRYNIPRELVFEALPETPGPVSTAGPRVGRFEVVVE